MPTFTRVLESVNVTLMELPCSEMRSPIGPVRIRCTFIMVWSTSDMDSSLEVGVSAVSTAGTRGLRRPAERARKRMVSGKRGRGRGEGRAGGAAASGLHEDAFGPQLLHQRGDAF